MNKPTMNTAPMNTVDTDVTGSLALDGSTAAGYEVMAALDTEIAALDVVLLRCRATMLLAAAGELTHLRRASIDLDQAAKALEHSSESRDAAVSSAAGVWDAPIEVASDLAAVAPAEFRPEFENRMAHLRGLLQEATEAIEVASVLSQHCLDNLSHRRSELEQGAAPLTYGARGQTPPVVIHEMV